MEKAAMTTPRSPEYSPSAKTKTGLGLSPGALGLPHFLPSPTCLLGALGSCSGGCGLTGHGPNKQTAQPQPALSCACFSSAQQTPCSTVIFLNTIIAPWTFAPVGIVFLLV